MNIDKAERKSTYIDNASYVTAKSQSMTVGKLTWKVIMRKRNWL